MSQSRRAGTSVCRIFSPCQIRRGGRRCQIAPTSLSMSPPPPAPPPWANLTRFQISNSRRWPRYARHARHGAAGLPPRNLTQNDTRNLYSSFFLSWGAGGLLQGSLSNLLKCQGKLDTSDLLTAKFTLL